MGINFNEKDVVYFGMSQDRRDHSGYLKKKGFANPALKERYFVLKGNLLFYFKSPHEPSPQGFILLELFVASPLVDQHTDNLFVEFGILIEFESLNRSYVLVAKDREDMNRWIKAIHTCSFQGLQNKIKDLQKEINSLRRAKNESKIFMKNDERFSRITSAPSLDYEFPQELPPRLLSTKAISPEELFPVYQKKERLDVSFTCVLKRSVLELMMMSEEATIYQLIVCRLTEKKEERLLGKWIECGRTEPSLVQETVGEVGSYYIEFFVSVPLKVTSGQVEQYRFVITKCSEVDYSRPIGTWGEVYCTSEEIREWKDKKFVLKYKNPDLNVSGQVVLAPVEYFQDTAEKFFGDYIRCPITMMSFERHTQSYRSINSFGQVVRIKEIMLESPFTFYGPINFLRFLIRCENELIENIKREDNETWSTTHGISRKRQLIYHYELISTYKNTLNYLIEYKEKSFRPSTHKKEEHLQFIPINCHVQELLTNVNFSETTSVYSVVTVGAPAAHEQGFKKGGATTLVENLKEQIQDVSAWLKTGLLTPPIKSQDARGRRALSITALTKDGTTFVTSNSNKSIVRSDPTRPKKEAVEELQSEFLNSLEIISEIVSTQNVARKKFEQIDSLRDTLRKTIDKALSFQLDSFQDQQDDEGHKILTEVIRSTSLPQFEQCLTELIAMISFKKISSPSLATNIPDEFISDVSHNDWEDSFDKFAASKEILSTQFNTFIGIILGHFSFLIEQEEHENKYFINLRLRLDQIFSQAITALITCFSTFLNRKFDHPFYLKQISEIGFLAVFESLLSTRGDELGMLGDMTYAVKSLENVKFKFACSNDVFSPVEFGGQRENYIITFNIDESHFQRLPESLKQGNLIPIHPVLLTQGINESQTVANTLRSNQFQDEINAQYFPVLEKYYTSFQQFIQKQENFGGKTELQEELKGHIMTCINELNQSILKSKANKNVNILIHGEEIARKLNGGRLTSCKSAKDRTSMSVTLEQTMILSSTCNIEQSNDSQLRDAMRSQGTRIENVLKNTGGRRYAFNSLQLKTLPKLYRPPKGVSGGGAA